MGIISILKTEEGYSILLTQKALGVLNFHCGYKIKSKKLITWNLGQAIQLNFFFFLVIFVASIKDKT